MSRDLVDFAEFKPGDGNKDDSLSFPSDIINSPSHTYGTKCGNILTTNYYDFALICSFCSNSYDNIVDFGEHLRKNHRQNNDRGLNIECLDMDNDSVSEAVDRWDEVQNIKSETLHVDDKQYVCMFCKMSFRTSDCLEQHECDPEYLMVEDWNFPESPEIVDDCNDLETKINECVPRLYTCEVCKKQYSCKIRLNRCCRFSPLSKQQIFVCVLCKHEFSTESSLESHKCESGNEPGASAPTATTCTDCNKQYDSMETFKRHRCLRSREDSFLKMKTNGTDDLPGKLVEKATLVKSIRSKEKVRSKSALYCELCDRHFKLSSSLKRHAIEHEVAPIALQNSPGYLTCHTCNAKFSNHIEWCQHESTCCDASRHKCPHCPKAYTTRYALNMHINCHTGARPFKCSKCPASFAHHANLSRHNKRVHLKHYPYACHLCDVKCVHKSELRFHMRKHTGERPHQCDLCGKRFIQLVLLRQHLKRHANIKDIQCPVCPMAFVTKKRLKDHMVKHSNERPHACDVCGDSFSRRKAMIAHSKIHLPRKEYVCQICGKEFAQHPGLYSHMKSHGVVKSDKSALDI